jgi:hypothetical protein
MSIPGGNEKMNIQERIQYLKKLEENRDIDGLVKALDYLNGVDATQYTKDALLRIRDKRVVPALTKALGIPGLRVQAAYLLGRLGDESVIPKLEEILKHPLETEQLFYFVDDGEGKEQAEKEVVDTVTDAIETIKKRHT